MALIHWLCFTTHIAVVDSYNRDVAFTNLQNRWPSTKPNKHLPLESLPSAPWVASGENSPGAPFRKDAICWSSFGWNCHYHYLMNYILYIQYMTTSYLNNNFIIIQFNNIIPFNVNFKLSEKVAPWILSKALSEVPKTASFLVRLLLSNSVGRRNLYVWEACLRWCFSSTKNCCNFSSFTVVLFGPEIFI